MFDAAMIQIEINGRSRIKRSSCLEFVNMFGFGPLLLQCSKHKKKMKIEL